MKIKHLCAILIIMMSSFISITSFALNPPDELTVSVTESAEAWKTKSEKNKLSEKDKAELKAKHEELKAKWDSLNKDQKEEIYRLHEKSMDIKSELIDKYLEYGMIDKEAASGMKEKMNEHKANMRNNGELPGYRVKSK